MYILDISLILQSVLIILWIQMCFWLAYNPKDLRSKKFLFFKDTQKRTYLKLTLMIVFILCNIQRKYLFSLEF